MEKLDQMLVRAWTAIGLALAPRSGREEERGDVPGWVMITVMTAGLVGGLTVIAGPYLKQMLIDALTSVGG